MGKLAVLTRLCASIADEYERGEKVDSGAVSASTTRIFDLLLQSQSRSSSEAMIPHDLVLLVQVGVCDPAQAFRNVLCGDALRFPQWPEPLVCESGIWMRRGGERRRRSSG